MDDLSLVRYLKGTMVFSIVIICTVTLLRAAYSKDLTLEHVRPCNEGHFPKSVHLQTCHALDHNVCHIHIGDKIAVHTEFESESEHYNEYELEVSTDLNGKLYSRAASHENYKVDCRGLDCSVDHLLHIRSYMPVVSFHTKNINSLRYLKGKHTLRYELKSVRNRSMTFFCYEIDVELAGAQ
ncbi:hypothetical protein ACOME3_005744 [Neoechinorhynchus agilis]